MPPGSDADQTMRTMHQRVGAIEEQTLRAGRTSRKAPGPGDEVLLVELAWLLQKLDAEAAQDAEAGSLLSEIAAENPRFVPRVNRLFREHNDIRTSMRSLREQISSCDLADVRAWEVRWGLAALARRLRRYRARETLVIYEAVNRDLGVGD
jgi:hypothetical protein